MNRNDAAISLLTDILAEVKREREAMDKLANAQFGLSRDLRRWFKSASAQPVLDFEIKAMETMDRANIEHHCSVSGCRWHGTPFDWYDHANKEHGRELPEWIVERRKREMA